MEENKNSSNIRIPRVLYNCLLGFFVIVFLVSLILIARYGIESFRNGQGYDDHHVQGIALPKDAGEPAPLGGGVDICVGIGRKHDTDAACGRYTNLGLYSLE